MFMITMQKDVYTYYNINQKEKQTRQKVLILTHSSRIQSIRAGNSRWQDLEVTGHISSIVKKQKEIHKAKGAQLFFSLSHLGQSP